MDQVNSEDLRSLVRRSSPNYRSADDRMKPPPAGLLPRARPRSGIGSFPGVVSAFAAETTGTYAYSTALQGPQEVAKRVAHYRDVENVTVIRIATYRLESVEVVYTKEDS